MDPSPTSRRPTDGGRDPFEMIEDEHERIEGMLGLLGRIIDDPTEPPSPSVAMECFRRLDRELRLQHRTEERWFYSRLDSADPQVRQGLDQHRHMERLLAELAAIDPTSDVWIRRARSLMWFVELHFHYEEEDVFERAHTELSSEDLRKE